MKYIQISLISLALVAAGAIPGFAQKRKGIDFLPTSIRHGAQVPYPVDVLYGSTDSDLVLVHYSDIEKCTEACKDNMEERLEALSALRQDIQRSRLAILWRPLVATDEQARAAMSFACLPPEHALSESMKFLRDRTDRTDLPVPERYMDKAESLGISREAFARCVENKDMWDFYKRHTNNYKRRIAGLRPSYDWIKGRAVKFNADYLRGFINFIKSSVDYKRAPVLRKILPSDIVVGKPAPDKIRMTMYFAPDGQAERDYINKNLQKFIQVFVASGDVYLVIRPFSWYRLPSIRATEFLSCVPADYKLHIMEQIYISLDKWNTANFADPQATLLQLAAFNGLNERKIKGCLNSPSTARKVAAERKLHQDQLSLVLTPTIFMNDELFAIGSPGFGDMMSAVRSWKAKQTMDRR